MNIVTKITGALGSIGRHPVNHDRKWRAVLEYGFIQVAALIVQRDVCVKFPNDTRLLVSPRMKGAAHFITPGLCEFEDMSFVMHFLRPGEMFADVGANVGAFTVLAAGVAGARTVSFEPSPDTYAMLRRNVGVNHLDGLVRAVNAAVGGKPGTVQFSIGLGTENHVAAASEKDGSASIRMTTLDLELTETPAILLKVDVEGFETEVFAGGGETLANPALQAIVIERNNSGNRYGYDEEALHAKIRGQGFSPCSYDPFKRQLQPLKGGFGNIIYIRDIKSAGERLAAAKPFELGSLKV